MESEIELSEVITDIAAGPFGSNLKVDCFVPSGFPIIDGANLKGLKVTDNLTKFVTEEKARSLSRSIAKRGDVVVTISGTLGQIAYVPDDSVYEEYLCSQRQFKVTFDTKRVYVPYLVYYFHTREGQSKILAFANQTGVPALAQPTKNFKKIMLTLPPLQRQKQIASVGELLTAKIETNSKLNGYLEELLLAQFASLVPNNKWTEGRADAYYEIGIGKTPPRKEPEWFSNTRTGNHVWLSIKDMGEAGAYSLDSSEYLTDDAVRAKNVRRVPAGSILLSFKLTVGRVKIAGCDMTTNEAIACFSSKDKRMLAYAYPFLLSYDYGKLGSTSSIATAVNSKTIKAMPFVVPSDPELDAFFATTKPVYEQLLANANESRSLTALRDALLPKLISGEIDVSKVDLTQLNSHLV
ncbi:restriction endonuclease subunit S [Paratractidigestivibacter sp.]|uniref:restriction endonuclease subunit S n=1 Tax=Paratractidigestivibacter sp. TaxID=2847316 RepID=UPI002AC9D9BB|nr:restriction endonuclease subunit S [Paratractidigestivibacter sp.]